jgi:hypothetical protein
MLGSAEGAGIAQSVQCLDYRLDDRATGVQSLAEVKDFSFSLCVKTSSEAHPASYQMGTKTLSQE